AAVGHHQGGQHLEEGRLAGAVGSEEPEDLTGTDLEADVVEGRGPGPRPGVAEALAERSRHGKPLGETAGADHRLVGRPPGPGEVEGEREGEPGPGRRTPHPLRRSK